MNFLSHYYLDKELDDSWFFVGVSTPDLVSVFDREVRLKPRLMPLVMENEASAARLSFYNGVLRHFEVDRMFHSSDFFQRETREIMDRLKAVFQAGEVERSFFVAHILFELLLDKCLIHHDSTLLPSFYRHIGSPGIGSIVRETQWISKHPLPHYHDFLDRFLFRKYLYQYQELSHVLQVLRSILKGVGIDRLSYLGSKSFSKLLLDYEEALNSRCLAGFAELTEQLCEA